ncbi:hypothetical protein [Actinoallomurus sp. NPDC050550]|uniref:hypothetical protein n=1 Tax=Actinoallomurus sp. NPDC050550 TaxID=3154937 RepID=UPI0033D4ABC6
MAPKAANLLFTLPIAEFPSDISPAPTHLGGTAVNTDRLANLRVDCDLTAPYGRPGGRLRAKDRNALIAQ